MLPLDAHFMSCLPVGGDSCKLSLGTEGKCWRIKAPLHHHQLHPQGNAAALMETTVSPSFCIS